MPVGLQQATWTEASPVSRQLGTMFLALTLLFMWFPASAERVAIIGTGNVAAALGPEFAAQGPVERRQEDLSIPRNRDTRGSVLRDAVVRRP